MKHFKASFGVKAEVPDPVSKGGAATGSGQELSHLDDADEAEMKPTGVKASASMPGATGRGDRAPIPQGSSRLSKEEIEYINSLDEEELMELDKNTLASYLKKAGASSYEAAFNSGYDFSKNKNIDRSLALSKKRKRGMDTAIDKLSKEDLDIADDINAIFEGSDLSEDFKGRAVEIFETAVVAKVNEKIEEIEENYEELFEDAKEEFASELTEKLEEYLDYVVEQWMEDNELAVETGLKAQMTESFLSGLRDLFTEHYVDIPEEKIDVVEELAQKNASLEEVINSEMEKNIALTRQLQGIEKAIAFSEVTEGLTDTQVAKLEVLSEAIEYSDNFKEKLEMIRENYFPSDNKEVRKSTLDVEPLNEEENKKVLDPTMNTYLQAISRTIKK